MEKICTAHQKIAIVLQKIATSTFSQTTGILLSYWHTKSAFAILAHFLSLGSLSPILSHFLSF